MVMGETTVFCIAGVWGHLFLGVNGEGKRKESV
jgi:hypothetical protein